MTIHENIQNKFFSQSISARVEDFPPLLAPYRGFKCTTGQSSWINSSDAPASISASGKEWNVDTMLSEFAYCVAGSDYFPVANFDLSKSYTLLAERYGGRGVGGNGGGARCGLVNGIQLKGSGGNCLVGQGVDWWHTTGCLQLTDAVVEVIYAGLIQTILPSGAARCYGIIDTSMPAPYYLNGDRNTILNGRGALLLREALLRPAHFIRSPHFVSSPTSRPLLAPDTLRVKQAIKSLQTYAQANGGIETILSRSLAANARQFAVAKLQRITHSTITPSNLSFGGEWLDLTTCSLVPSGINYKFGMNQPSFYLEAIVVPQAYEELVDTYNKYIGCKINSARLNDYYQQAFLRSAYRESPQIFGLGSYVLKPAYHQLYQPLAEYLHQIIGRDKGITSGYPRVRENTDPLHVVLRNLYLSLSNTNLVDEQSLQQLPIRFPASLVENFRNLMRVGFQRYARGAPDFTSYCKRAVIQLFRREFLRDIGYRNRINDTIHPLVDQGTINFQGFIDFHHNSFKFAFNNVDDDEVGVLDIDGLSIKYVCAPNNYRVVLGCNEIYINKLTELRQLLETLDYNQLQKFDYDFKPYLQDLFSILQHFE
ncbi:MAG: hypothetical protein EOO52_15035 [Gammaproteobacteria bacterium]|nr:MAG: hypothetical protein EOO52_15035 [Gammaproteobacteria bacterium]